MENNITNKNTTATPTFPLRGIMPATEGELFYLEYLGYEGPAPLTSHEADVLIAALLRTEPDEENVKVYDEDDELNDDGFAWGEIKYARMMRLRWKEGQD